MQKIFLDISRAKNRFAHQTKVRGIDLQKETPIGQIDFTFSPEKEVVVEGEMSCRSGKEAQLFHPKILFHLKTSMLIGTECNCSERRMCPHAFALLSSLEKKNSSKISPTGTLDVSPYFISDQELERIQDKSDEWLRRNKLEKETKKQLDGDKVDYNAFVELLYLEDKPVSAQPFALRIILDLTVQDPEISVSLLISSKEEEASTRVDFSSFESILQSKKKVRIGRHFFSFNEEHFDPKELQVVYAIARVGVEKEGLYTLTHHHFTRIAHYAVEEGTFCFYQKGEEHPLSFPGKSLSLYGQLQEGEKGEKVQFNLSYLDGSGKSFQGTKISGKRPLFLQGNELFRLDPSISTSIWVLFEQMVEKGLPKSLFPSFYNYTLREMPRSVKVEVEPTLVSSLPQEEHTLEVKVDLSWDSGDVMIEMLFSYGGESEKLKEGSALTFGRNAFIVRDLKRERELIQLLTKWCHYSPLELKYVVSSDSFDKYYMDVYLPMKDEVEFRMHSSLKKKIVEVRLNGKGALKESKNPNFLEVSFEFSHLKHSTPIEELKRILINKDEIAKRRKGGWIVDSGESVEKKQKEQNLLEAMEKLKIREVDKNVNCLIPKWNLFFLLQLFKEGELELPPGVDQLANEYRSFLGGEREDLSITKLFKGSLREYQVDGVHWLLTLQKLNLHGILADDMGLGKTIQTIALLQTTMEKQKKEKIEVLPSLIICPKSLVTNWKLELLRFAPELTTLSFEGDVEERKGLVKEMEAADVVVASYSIFKKDLEAFQSRQWNYMILDEAQHIKNPTTQNAVAAKTIESSYRLVLTGTPIENGLEDLWSLLDFLMPGYLEKKMIAQSKEEVTPFILRRVKKDVLKDLPDVTSIVQQAEMCDKQKSLYLQVRDQLITDIDSQIRENGEEGSKMYILAALTRLKQICCDPELIGAEEGLFPSVKRELLMEIVEEIVDGNHKAVIFSQYVSMLKIIERELSKRGIAFRSLYGETKNRMDAVNQFNEDHSIPLFLVSLKAGGVGLNLTGADRVILYDPWWNAAAEEQAIARVHRIGQRNPVISYKLIAKGTIEEKIAALQNQKKELFEGWIEQRGESLTKMKWKEIKTLLCGEL